MRYGQQPKIAVATLTKKRPYIADGNLQIVVPPHGDLTPSVTEQDRLILKKLLSYSRKTL